jgi:hypothetical protein
MEKCIRINYLCVTGRYRANTIAFREDDVTTGAALYFLINELWYARTNTGHRNGFRLFSEAISVKLVHV